ncbi:MAG: GAF domain-containing protein [Thermodesulfobacteriota bacterium]
MLNPPVAKKEENLVKRYKDLLDIGRVVSWCTDRDYLIKTCLDHISQRLEKRARCVLMEGKELKLHCWVGKYDGPIEQGPIHKESMVWKVIREGKARNLTDPQEMEGYGHTLPEAIKIKSIIPLWYVDSSTQEEKVVGALIVDSGKEGSPVTTEDFEYLKAIGELIGAAVGKGELLGQLVKCNREREAMVKETVDSFRNRVATIGAVSRRIKRLAENTGLVQEAEIFYKEVQALETHLGRFEKYVDTRDLRGEPSARV